MTSRNPTTFRDYVKSVEAELDAEQLEKLEKFRGRLARLCTQPSSKWCLDRGCPVHGAAK